MFRFILRRVLWAIPTLFVVTFLVYCAIRFGTDPVQSYKRTAGFDPNVLNSRPSLSVR